MLVTLIFIMLFIVSFSTIIYGFIVNDDGSIIGFGLIIFILTSVISLTIIDGNNRAIASEKANQWCINRGYDTYDTFKRKAFENEPFGIKCNYIKNRKEVITNANVIAVTN